MAEDLRIDESKEIESEVVAEGVGKVMDSLTQFRTGSWGLKESRSQRLMSTNLSRPGRPIEAR